MSLKSKVESLISAGNETTGQSKTDLTSVVQDLVDGYGQGGGGVTVESLSVTQNGTYTAPTGKAYSPVNVSVPNSYSASDEGKVVDNGALVAQTSTTYTTNDTYDTTLINEVIVAVSGGSIDLSALEQDVTKWNIGGLFKGFENGNWDYLEYTCVSGTSPITIDFGRKINGFICYPKNLTAPSGNESTSFTMQTYTNAVNEETGVQTLRMYFSNRTANVTDGFPRITSAKTKMINGVLSMTPTYPSNASYHPFRFGYPYIFVYWWEATT